jgi:hypothetical protein
MRAVVCNQSFIQGKSLSSHKLQLLLIIHWLTTVIISDDTIN